MKEAEYRIQETGDLEEKKENKEDTIQERE